MQHGHSHNVRDGFLACPGVPLRPERDRGNSREERSREREGMQIAGVPRVLSYEVQYRHGRGTNGG